MYRTAISELRLHRKGTFPIKKQTGRMFQAQGRGNERPWVHNVN